MKSEEYWEGYRAYYMNRFAECPYDAGTSEWVDWNEGFDQAESELSTEELPNKESE